jgi:hypothetical protein
MDTFSSLPRNSSSPSTLPLASPGMSLGRFHTGALHTTPRLARTTSPPFSLTPTARPRSTRTSSTSLPSLTLDPAPRTPSTIASTSAPIPPSGYASVAPSSCSSPSTAASAAAGVREAGSPEREKASASSHQRRKGEVTGGR